MVGFTWGRAVRFALVPAAAVVWCSVAGAVPMQSDDFDDGNDAGWAHYAPLAPFGADGAYSFPDGGYRIEAPVSPAPGQLGPARAGSFKDQDSYSQFFVSVDVTGWNDTLDQSFGFLTRVKEAGLGTTDGYAFTYSNDGPSIDISLITDEAVTETRATKEIKILPIKPYRLVFEGDGTSFTGSLFDLEDLTTPLATISATDDTWAEGINGIFVFDNSGGTKAADATFDNYFATVPEPGSAALLLALAFPLCGRRRA